MRDLITAVTRKKAVIWALMTNLIMMGCSAPAVLYKDRLYIGIHDHQKVEYKKGSFHKGEYHKLKGFGASFGLFAFGLGYYDLQYLEIDKTLPGLVSSPLATVLITDDIEEITIFAGTGVRHEMR